MLENRPDTVGLLRADGLGKRELEIHSGNDDRHGGLCFVQEDLGVLGKYLKRNGRAKILIPDGA